MLDPDIQALVELGDNIAAIGLYQQRNGGSVLAARKAIEAARWALTQSRGAALDASGQELDDLLRRGDKLAAVARYRELHGVGLVEARIAIDARQTALRAAAERPAPATMIGDPELDAALRRRDKVDAIKRYRDLHGVGLKEAKDAVEAILAGAPAPALPPVATPTPHATTGYDQPGMQPELDRLIAADQKIAAIKHYRDITGLGLKECKDAVEARIAAGVAAAHASPSGLQPELDRLIRAEQRVSAVKHYRTITGVGLREAVEAVDARTAELAAAPATPQAAAHVPPGIDYAELERLIAAGRKIEAIKYWREVTHAGLKEAKDAVEDHMAKLAGAPAASAPDWLVEVDRHIAADHKINAIKLWREHTGVGLKEAKDAVEARMAGSTAPPRLAAPPAPPTPVDWLAEVDRFIAAGQKINAIKVWREHNPVGLKEAKDAVEARMAEQGR